MQKRVFLEKLTKAMKDEGIQTKQDLYRLGQECEDRREEKYNSKRKCDLLEQRSKVKRKIRAKIAAGSTTKPSEAQINRLLDAEMEKREEQYPEYKRVWAKNDAALYRWFRTDGHYMPFMPDALQLDIICEVCKCDPQFLLDPDSTTRRIINQNTHDATGLSEEAIETLRKLSHAPRADYEFFPEVTGFNFADYTIGLISYMLTDEMEILRSVIRRMINLNFDRYNIAHLSKTAMNLYTRAYDHATEKIRISIEGHGYNKAKELFVSYVEDELAAHGDEYAEAEKKEIPSNLYDIQIRGGDDLERIFMADAPNDGIVRRVVEVAPDVFAALHRKSKAQMEYINFLNSKNLYSIVEDFNDQSMK